MIVGDTANLIKAGNCNDPANCDIKNIQESEKTEYYNI